MYLEDLSKYSEKDGEALEYFKIQVFRGDGHPMYPGAEAQVR